MGLTPGNYIFPLVPRLYLGTKMVAKLSLASRGVPKLELGNEKKGGMRFAFPPYRLTPDHWLLAPGP